MEEENCECPNCGHEFKYDDKFHGVKLSGNGGIIIFILLCVSAFHGCFG